MFSKLLKSLHWLADGKPARIPRLSLGRVTKRRSVRGNGLTTKHGRVRVASR